MKLATKKLFVNLFFILGVFIAQAQSGKFLTPDMPITYLGVDFTQTKVINDPAPASDIKSRSYPAINQLIITEVKKFDWPKALGTANITNDLSIVNARNEAIDDKTIISTNKEDNNRLKPDDISRMVSKYNFDGKKGTGLIIFMEALSKTDENGTMWVTFVDMSAKKVLLTEKMSGKAMGFGFRNYYSYTVYKVIQDIKKNKLSEWRAK